VGKKWGHEVAIFLHTVYSVLHIFVLLPHVANKLNHYIYYKTIPLKLFDKNTIKISTCAAMPILPSFRVPIANLYPSPNLPKILLSGTYDNKNNANVNDYKCLYEPSLMKTVHHYCMNHAENSNLTSTSYC